MSVKHINLFRVFTTGVLVAFCALIALLIVADVAYVDYPAFTEVIGSANIQNALILSFGSSIVATALSVLVAVPAAYALSRYHFRGIIVLDTFIDLLIVVPVLVIGMSLLVFFRFASDFSQSSYMALRMVGYVAEEASDFFIYTRPGIVLAQFFCAVSFGVRAIKATFDGIDPRKEQVAMTLGCTRLGAFRRVTLPLAKPGIMAGALLSWARAFGVFGAVVIVGGSIRGSTEVLPTSIYLEMAVGNIKHALAITLIMLIAAAAVLVSVRMASGKSIFGT